MFFKGINREQSTKYISRKYSAQMHKYLIKGCIRHKFSDENAPNTNRIIKNYFGNYLFFL